MTASTRIRNVLVVTRGRSLNGAHRPRSTDLRRCVMADAPLDPAALVATMPFAVHAGVDIESASKDAVVGHVDWAEERCTIGGLMHGGA